jgi:hypothetical protein
VKLVERKSPLGFCAAVGAAASVIPFAWWLDSNDSSGGDGLQNFSTMVVFLGAAALLTVSGVIAGFWRTESQRWLAALAVMLWLAPLALVM